MYKVFNDALFTIMLANAARVERYLSGDCPLCNHR